MFREHQPIIGTWARSSPENLARTIQFCIISARQKFFNVPALIQEAHAPGSGALYGWKSDAYREVWEQREAIWWTCCDIWYLGGPERDDTLLGYLSGLHGLNCAKAGFACQLAFGVSGCLDTVNNARLGLPPRYLANFGQLRTVRARARRAAAYNKTIAGLGGTATLWDDWCAAMATRYPAQFPTAHAASAFHLTCLNLEGA